MIFSNRSKTTSQLTSNFDTWHGMCNKLCYCFLHVRLSLGTKNVAKGLTKITRGRGIDTIKAQLLDKSMFKECCKGSYQDH